MENSQEEVRARITDPRSGAVYLVTAWRPITRDEAIAAIKAFRSANPQISPQRGEEITVHTIIGLRG